MTRNQKDPRAGDPIWPERPYEVGYGKPPKQTRFAKGQSGNPLGRPRKEKPRTARLSDAPSDSFLETEAYRLVTLRENGQEVELPVMQAVFRALTTGAIKGNRLSQRYLIEHIARAEEISFRAKVATYDRLRALKREGEETLAKYKGKNTPAPAFFPHPDDIFLNPATGEAWVNGPLSPEEARHYDHSVALRDHLITRAADVETRIDKSASRDGNEGINAYLLFAHLLDRFLPARYRWQENEDLMLMLSRLNLSQSDRKRRIDVELKALIESEPKTSLVSSEDRRRISEIVDRWAARRTQRV